MAARDEIPVDPGRFDRGSGPPPQGGPSERDDIVVAAVENLPEEERAVVELLFWGRWRWDDAAAELGVSRATLGRRLQSARHRLEEILERQIDFG